MQVFDERQELIKTMKGKSFKGCVPYIFASLFCMSKRVHFLNKKLCSLFYF